MSKLVVVLDHDMTLVNTFAYFFRAYNLALARFGHAPISFREFYERYREESLSCPPGAEPRGFWDYFGRVFRTFPEEPVHPMKGAKRLLEAVREKGAPAYVVTGRSVEREVVVDELRRAGLAELVSGVYTLIGISASRPFDKSSLFTRLVLEAEGCIVIGDYSGDIVAARSAGCLAIGVLSMGKEPGPLLRAGAGLLVGDLDELVHDFGGLVERAMREGGRNRALRSG